MRRVAVTLFLVVSLAVPATAHTQGELGPPSSHTSRCEGWAGVDHGMFNDGGNWFHTLTRTLYSVGQFDVIQNHYRSEVRNGFVVYNFFHGFRTMC